MRILMFGRGVISTIYGQALQAAGHDVQFYVRPGRAAEYGGQVRMDVIDARRRHGPIRGAFPIRFRESLDAREAFDLVVLSVGHHHLAEAAAFLAPRVGHATVLVFGNLWEEPVDAVAPLHGDQVVFGFPQAGGGFRADGALRGALFRSVVLGAAQTDPGGRESTVQAAFGKAGITVRRERDMRGWLGLHFVANAGMFAHGGALAGMVGDRRAFRDAFLTSRELLPVLEARGIDLRRHRTATLPYRLPSLAAALAAGATARIPIAQASLLAHTDRDAAEPRAIVLDMWREARRFGIRAPRLEAAVDRLA